MVEQGGVVDGSAAPKSSGVPTIPLPNIACQRRLTQTRCTSRESEPRASARARRLLLAVDRVRPGVRREEHPRRGAGRGRARGAVAALGEHDLVAALEVQRARRGAR